MRIQKIDFMRNQGVFEQHPKCHMKIMLGDFIEKIRKEGIIQNDSQEGEFI